MSSKLTVKKVVRMREPYHGEYQGKPYSIYEAEVDCVIDGADHSKTVVKSGKEDVIKNLAEGQTFWAEKQDRKGFVSYKLQNPLAMGDTGAAPRPAFVPRNEKAIVAQSSLKAAVDLVVAYPDPEKTTDQEVTARVIGIAAELMAWVEQFGK